MRTTIMWNHTHPAVLCNTPVCLSILLTIFAIPFAFMSFCALSTEKGMNVNMNGNSYMMKETKAWIDSLKTNHLLLVEKFLVIFWSKNQVLSKVS